MLSNSDVKGKDTNDNFFDEIYSEFSISRVKARRSINANPEKRGELNELLITNYANEQALQTCLKLQNEDLLFDKITQSFKEKITKWDYFVNWAKVSNHCSDSKKS
jgi:hypothetical protein